jgi:RNA polymerase sigma factor (sigma-70 family)
LAPFRKLNDNELSALTDEELIALQADARQASRPLATSRALGHLLNRHRYRARAWVQLKVPTDDVEDVVSEVTVSAISSVLEGTTVGEYVEWLRTIVHRRVADYHRRKEAQPQFQPLPEEHEADEEIWESKLGREPEAQDDPADEVLLRDFLQPALDELSDVHRRVIELAGPLGLGFDHRPAKEVASQINDQFAGKLDDPMTDANVHQILSRFRKRLRKLFEKSGGNPPNG